MMTPTDDAIEAIVQGEFGDPFAVLGPHVVPNGRKGMVVVRTFLPQAEQVRVIPTIAEVKPRVMGRIHPKGVFEALFSGRRTRFPYQLTASVVTDLAYEWGDANWMARRAIANALDAPITIYEVHVGSWARVPASGPKTWRSMVSRSPWFSPSLP